MKGTILLLIIFCACRPAHTDLSSQTAMEISKADIAMSDLAVKDGFYKALLDFAEDSVIIPKEGRLPIVGKRNLAEDWAKKTDTKAIIWKPFRAEASSSGDMGYTFGYWEFRSKDTTMYGNYFTLWKKQKDGTWKYVVDGGNNTPEPTEIIHLRQIK